MIMTIQAKAVNESDAKLYCDQCNIVTTQSRAIS